MSDKFNVEYLEVGDTFQGGPIEQGDFILAVMASGGEVEIDGNVVTILQLPKAKAVKAPVAVPAEVEAVVAATIEAIEEPPLVDLAAEEAVVEAPAPSPRRGRKPKAVAPVEASPESTQGE